MATRLREAPSGAAVEPLYRYDLPIEEDPIREVLDRRVPWIIHDETFSQQSFGTGPWPDQGWKLHVSATPLSAVDVLDRSLDVLLAAGVRFKVINTVALLATFNEGYVGVSQIGKFITVYPSDDSQAVRLAVELDAATAGLTGPRVPTDRPLRPGSLVHYRYGTMTRRSDAEADDNPDGALDLLDGAGRLTNDVRLAFYWPPPPEVEDPFEAAGVRVAPPKRGRFLNGRYLVVGALGQSRRGGIFQAVDVASDPPRPCLVKEAWHHVGLDPYGRDARDWAANEQEVLSRHGDGVVLPRFYDSFELDDDRYIVIEFLDGTSFDKVLSDEHPDEAGLDPADIVAIGLDTAKALDHMHRLGLLFRDFKPANLIRTPEGRYRLIDFGIVHRYLEDDSVPLSPGTPPFCTREAVAGDDPQPADDVFAWGTVLYHLAAGTAAVADLPDDFDFQQPFARRPIRVVRPDFPAELAEVIDRACAWDRADRYADMGQAGEALVDAVGRLERSPSTVVADEKPRSVGRGADDGIDPAAALTLAREVGDALCDSAEQRSGGLCWQRTIEWSKQTAYSPDVYAGAAGIGLYLAELARATGDERYADAARGAARWIAGPAWGRGRAQHGLHDGEAGIAYFFVRLAELLDEPGYVTAAELRLRRLRGAPARTVDLMYGTAGTLLALLGVHAVTGDQQLLDDACTAGDELLLAALQAPDGRPGCFWNVASAYPGGPVIPYVGLFHGAAGMGLALAVLSAVTGEQRFLDAATGVAELLLDRAMPGAGGGLTWPRHVGDPATGLQAPCHGAAGVGQFFLALDRLASDSRYKNAAEGAARTMVAVGATERRSGLCHGVSGAGDFLLDCYQAFGDQRWLSAANECAAALDGFKVADRPGVYAMHDDDAVSPDLFLGYAGVGSFFLRLADPESKTDPVLGALTDALAGRRAPSLSRSHASEPIHQH